MYLCVFLYFKSISSPLWQRYPEVIFIHVVYNRAILNILKWRKYICLGRCSIIFIKISCGAFSSLNLLAHKGGGKKKHVTYKLNAEKNLCKIRIEIIVSHSNFLRVEEMLSWMWIFPDWTFWLSFCLLDWIFICQGVGERPIKKTGICWSCQFLVCDSIYFLLFFLPRWRPLP